MQNVNHFVSGPKYWNSEHENLISFALCEPENNIGIFSKQKGQYNLSLHQIEVVIA